MMAFFVSMITAAVRSPSQTHASQHIPEGWKIAIYDGILLDTEPHTNLAPLHGRFEPFLQPYTVYLWAWKRLGIVHDIQLRAVEHTGGSLGLSDAVWFLENQAEIPTEIRDNYIVFSGTVLIDTNGRCKVPYLWWTGNMWVLGFDHRLLHWYVQGNPAILSGY